MGLFDRRAAAAIEATLSRERDDSEWQRGRLAALERAAVSRATEPRLLLILAPRS
jgi:hypothetical protein